MQQMVRNKSRVIGIWRFCYKLDRTYYVIVLLGVKILLKPIKRRTLAEGIIEQIKEQIVDGNFSPGGRLPTEMELSNQLSVSRASVREAMRALSAMGIIDIRVGEGTFLASSVTNLFSGELSSKLLIMKSNLLEVIEARKIIETQLAELAAVRAVDDDIKELDLILSSMKEKLDNRQSFGEIDVTFHILIAEAAGNSILYEALSTIRQLLKNNYEEVIKIPGMGQKSYEQHKKILKAIKNHNSKEAGEAMMEHLTMVESKTKELTPDE